MATLAERAMTITLNISAWSGRKLDRKVSREVNEQHGAAADASRTTKRLLAKTALAAIKGIDNQARAYFYSVTSPWLNNGPRVISNLNYPEAARKLQAFRQDREREVEAFVAAYPALIEEARAAELGDLFDEADYPSPEDIDKRFEFRVNILPLPDAADFRCDLADGQIADIKEAIKAASAAALEAAMRDTWQRVYDVTEAMRERLPAYTPGTDGIKATGTFHDTLVTNIRSLVDVLPGLNLANDPALSAMVDRLRDELTGYDAQTLRDDADIRQDTAAAAEAILAHVSDYLA